MIKNRFCRIIKEIKSGSVKNARDRKDILFFGDFYGMMIFDSINCKSKKFFIPNNLKVS